MWVPDPADDLLREVFPAGRPETDATNRDFADLRVLAGEIFEGTCPVCGSRARFTGFNNNLRESGFCSVCGSTNRNRQMASLVRRRYGMPALGAVKFPADFVIYNAESSGPLHNQFKTQAHYVCSEYWGPEYRPGEIVKGIRHEDLQQLSFGDDSIDLVLSSDVLEHMPDPYRAHQEIFRVLKNGGRHIFTVPFVMESVTDEVRARVVDGEVVYLKEKIYHGDPIRPEEGVLVWTVFGMEMLDKLTELGFECAMWILHEPSRGVFGRNNSIFEAKKP